MLFLQTGNLWSVFAIHYREFGYWHTICLVRKYYLFVGSHIWGRSPRDAPLYLWKNLPKLYHLAGDFSFNRRLSFEIYGNMKLGFSLFYAIGN